MMMMQALLLTIFIASFRKQSGRRMRKYGLVQPTDKQSGSYDDHHDFDPSHFWMLMMILILFYQAFFLSLIFHFWSIPLCLLWWNGFRSKTIIVNSFLIWVTFTFHRDLFFQNGGKNHYRSSVLLSESLSGVSPFSRQSVGCHLRIVGNWKHFQFRTKTFQQISQQLKAETKLIWINFPRYSIHRCWHIAVLYFSVIWIGKKMIKTEIQMSINKKHQDGRQNCTEAGPVQWSGLSSQLFFSSVKIWAANCTSLLKTENQEWVSTFSWFN